MTRLALSRCIGGYWGGLGGIKLLKNVIKSHQMGEASKNMCLRG